MVSFDFYAALLLLGVFQGLILSIVIIFEKSNSHGIGSKVRIKVKIDNKATWLSRWLLPQTGYTSQNEQQ